MDERLPLIACRLIGSRRKRSSRIRRRRSPTRNRAAGRRARSTRLRTIARRRALCRWSVRGLRSRRRFRQGTIPLNISLRSAHGLLPSLRRTLAAAVPYSVSQSETKSAHQHQRKEDEQQRPRAQRQLSIALAFRLL